MYLPPLSPVINSFTWCIQRQKVTEVTIQALGQFVIIWWYLLHRRELCLQYNAPPDGEFWAKYNYKGPKWFGSFYNSNLISDVNASGALASRVLWKCMASSPALVL